MIIQIFSPLIKKFKNRYWFKNQLRLFRQSESQTRNRFRLSKDNLFPIYDDATNETGFDRHYIYHTGWASRILAKCKPKMHVDISSSLYFSAIASAFCPIEFYDFRPAALHLSNLKTGSCNLLNLHFQDNSLKSLSCMHVVEHIGLGRYGDDIDYDGDMKAIGELKRVVQPGGSLLFVVPIGKPVVQFNAHRIYAYDQIIDLFPEFDLIQFALIPDSLDDGGLLIDASKELTDKQTYGCGCFWLRKKRKLLHRNNNS